MILDHFRAENIAPPGTGHIGVFKDGKKVGRIDLGSLTPPDRSKMLYSFGVLTDVEVMDTEDHASNQAFKKALEHLGADKDIAFICISGDLTETFGVGNEQRKKEAYSKYEDIVAQYNNKPIFAISGNHEQWRYNCDDPDCTDADCPKIDHPKLMKDHVGVDQCCYSFEYGDDVFIMAGCWMFWFNDVYQVQCQTKEDMDFIRGVMDASRNKRVFYFQHIYPDHNAPEYNIDTVTGHGYFPMSFYRHYKNMSIFHGHKHGRFDLQENDINANYSIWQGFRSVHTAACSGDDTGGVGSGYIVDVYKDGYHLRGMNFLTGEAIPIANYWIDTKLVTVADEYTYTEQE